MKRLTTKWMIAAAALAVAAGSASAQTLKAEIPFTFQAGKALMGPGTYEVKIDRAAGRAIFRLHNMDENRSILLVQQTLADAPKAWKDRGLPKLAFECGGSDCVLRELWTGSVEYAYQFPGRKLGRDETARVVEIGMTPVKGD